MQDTIENLTQMAANMDYTHWLGLLVSVVVGMVVQKISIKLYKWAMTATVLEPISAEVVKLSVMMTHPAKWTLTGKPGYVDVSVITDSVFIGYTVLGGFYVNVYDADSDRYAIAVTCNKREIRLLKSNFKELTHKIHKRANDLYEANRKQAVDRVYNKHVSLPIVPPPAKV